MTLCKNCNGEGLVGQGDQPWLKHGRIDTCPKCGGTGQIADDQAEATLNAPESASQESQPVDNSPSNLGNGSPENSGDEASPETPPTLG